MRTVETEAYKAPQVYGTLARSWGLRDAITRLGNFNDLPQTAQEMGFTRVGDLPTKKAIWQVYDRSIHEIPNFPEGATVISSTLAVRENDGKLTHALLRTSLEPYPTEEAYKDLEAFTKHYIERPKVLGFPSRASTNVLGGGVALLAGIVILSAADYYTIRTVDSVANMGMLVGELGAPTVYGVLWKVSEWHAKRQISDLGQYTSGDSARNTLHFERYHEVEVMIQKGLYTELQQEGADLTPDQFLTEIYGQMPQTLVQKRHAEVLQARYPGQYSPAETGNTFPKLVEVAHILQAA